MVADALTKSLPLPAFVVHCSSRSHVRTSPFFLKFVGGCRSYISTSNPGNYINHLMAELLERKKKWGAVFSSFRVAQSRYLHIVNGGER